MKTVELRCVQRFYENGQIASESFYLNDEFHNENGPAHRTWYENGQIKSESFCLNDKLHNETGPAYRRWYENGQLWSEAFYVSGDYHNETGPAYRSWDENGQLSAELFLLNDKRLTPEEFARRTSTCSGKIVEIDGKKYQLKEIK